MNWGEKSVTVLCSQWHILVKYSRSPLLPVRMAALGAQRADFIVASNKKASPCHLLKLKVERWWMHFVHQNNAYK